MATVKELRKLLETMDDDNEIVIYPKSSLMIDGIGLKRNKVILLTLAFCI